MLKRCHFTCVLIVENVPDRRRSTGRLFQARGPATARARSPMAECHAAVDVSWLYTDFLLHVKYTISHRNVCIDRYAISADSTDNDKSLTGTCVSSCVGGVSRLDCCSAQSCSVHSCERRPHPPRSTE